MAIYQFSSEKMSSGPTELRRQYLVDFTGADEEKRSPQHVGFSAYLPAGETKKAICVEKKT